MISGFPPNRPPGLAAKGLSLVNGYGLDYEPESAESTANDTHLACKSSILESIVNHPFLEMLVILALILINGFFALSEMSLVAARKVRLAARADKGSRPARIALKLKERPDKFLSTAQIGITLVALLTGAVSGTTLASRLQEHLAGIDALQPYSVALGMGIVLAGITFLTLILGELVPKKLAVAYPERMSCFTAPFMFMLMRLIMPAVRVLSASTRTVVRIFGLAGPKEPKVTEDDIRGLIREAVLYGEVKHSERDLLERVFRLDDLQVRSVMTHSSRIVWLDPDDEKATVQKILAHPHSRFPVARRAPFRILGAVKAKDYLGALLRDKTVTLESHLQPLLSVPDTMRVLSLLELFRQKEQMHFALVVDNDNEPQGVVTFNDILEAMVGDIPTLQSHPEPDAVRRDDGSWLMDGFMTIEAVQAKLGLEEDLREEGQSFQTLAGLVHAHAGDSPQMGEHFEWKGLRFEIVDLDGKRIDRILISRVGQV